MTNRVLFLGAGFSAGFDHPVMNRFLEVADASQLLTDKEKAFLGQLTLNTRRANSFLESSPTNLEDILSYAVMSDRLGFSGDEEFGPRIQEILAKIYSSVNDYQQYWGQAERFKSLLSHIFKRPEDRLAIVTTNYDLNAECAMMWAGEPTSVGFEYTEATVNKKVVGRLYENGGIPLYKLHGSVNWFPEEETQEVQVIDQIGQTVDFGKRDRRGLRPLGYERDCRKDHIPLIVPPSFLKPELSSLLREIWSGAAQRIADANDVIFIGYSFPPTDTEMAYFLAHAMANNPHLRRIAIIDPNVEEIIVRLKSEEGRFGSHFKGLLDPYSSDWRTVDSFV